MPTSETASARPTTSDEKPGNDEARSFAQVFDRVQTLIVEEWPSVSKEALAATGGDLEKVAAIVAESAGRTRALAKKQLAELASLARDAKDASGDEVQRLRARFEGLVEDLEQKSQSIVKKGDDLEREARKKVEENLWTSLLVALGLGFILGLLSGGRR